MYKYVTNVYVSGAVDHYCISIDTTGSISMWPICVFGTVDHYCISIDTTGSITKVTFVLVGSSVFFMNSTESGVSLNISTEYAMTHRL